jgi:RecA-family ATPase
MGREYGKIGLIIKKLYDKTMRGEIQWEKTNEGDVFQKSFSSYSVRLSFYDSTAGITYYRVSVFDANGELLEQVTDSQLGEEFENAYDTLSMLYVTARRQAMGVEKALDDILQLL